MITGAGHVCGLQGFVLGEAGRNGREGRHRRLQQHQNKPGIWLSTSWSCGLSCGPRAGKIPAGLCTFSTSTWEHAGEVPPACLSPPGWSSPLRLFVQPGLWGCNCLFGKILGNLSCNCPKRLLLFEIRLEPRLCHPSIRACAPLTRIYYTTNPLM